MLCGLSAIENGLNLSKFREQEAFCLDNAIKNIFPQYLMHIY